jgi:hypothetical protein
MSRRVLAALVAASGAILQAACSAPSAPVEANRDVAGPPVAKAPPAAVPAALPAGPRAEGDAFEVALVPPAGARAGEAAVARVVVKARGRYHVNRDYPMSFRPDPATAAAFGAEKVALGEGAERTPCTDHPAEACSISAPLRFTAYGTGESRLAGTVAFSVCNPERCLIEKVPLGATFAVR